MVRWMDGLGGPLLVGDRARLAGWTAEKRGVAAVAAAARGTWITEVDANMLALGEPVTTGVAEVGFDTFVVVQWIAADSDEHVESLISRWVECDPRPTHLRLAVPSGVVAVVDANQQGLLALEDGPSAQIEVQPWVYAVSVAKHRDDQSELVFFVFQRVGM